MKDVVLLVDGANVHVTAKALGFQVDYKKVLDTSPWTIRKAFFFTALRDSREQSFVRPMVDYLTYNGWFTVTKLMREWYDPVDNKVKMKGNMDTEIVTIGYEMASLGFDVVLFSGDGDFQFFVETVQRRYGTRVTVVSSIQTKPPMCADILRRQCDEFIDLADQREHIIREKEEY